MDKEIINKYSNVPKDLIDINSIECAFYGGDGGNADSPVWLCALEWGGGYTEESPYIPQTECVGVDAISTPMTVGQVIDGISGIWSRNEEGEIEKKSPSRIYQVYMMLLTAITTGKVDCKGLCGEKLIKRLEEQEIQYQFFTKDRYGLLVNAFTVAMPSRARAENIWTTSKCVEVSENPQILKTFAEWSTIPTFDEYLAWCTAVRRKTLSAIRKKYHPAIIYCGGLTEESRLFRIWTEESEEGAPIVDFFNAAPPKTRQLRLSYRWLENGEGVNPTLLVVGPFYSGQASCLNDPETCEAAGQRLREIMSTRFANPDIWLQPERFLPSQT